MVYSTGKQLDYEIFLISVLSLDILFSIYTLKQQFLGQFWTQNTLGIGYEDK